MKQQQIRLIILSFVLVFLVNSTVNGKPISEKMKVVPPESFVRTFLGMCAQNPGKYGKIIEIAKSFRFGNIPERMIAGFAPQDPNAEWKGVIVLEGEGAPYFIGVSKGRLNRRVMTTCVIANPFISSRSVTKFLKLFANLSNPLQDRKSAGQRHRVWLTDHWTKNSFISLTDSEPMGISGVTIAFTSPLDE